MERLAFNSLFEIRRHLFHGSAMKGNSSLSILFLRFLRSCGSVIASCSDTPFNSLFEIQVSNGADEHGVLYCLSILFLRFPS